MSEELLIKYFQEKNPWYLESSVNYEKTGDYELTVEQANGTYLVFNGKTGKWYRVYDMELMNTYKNPEYRKNNLPNRIKNIMELKCCTQEELAERSGLSLVSVNRIINGKTRPKTDTLYDLAIALGVSINELIS